jgi:hypothetical protein
MALLVPSGIIIADGEFHRKSSEWVKHGHHMDKRYSGVYLHIVLEIDDPAEYTPETLLVDFRQMSTSEDNDIVNKSVDMNSAEDLQVYALNRLLRRSAELKKMMLAYQHTDKALLHYLQAFLYRLSGLSRRRPAISSAPVLDWFYQTPLISHFIQNGASDFSAFATQFMGLQLPGLGMHMRVEILVNCLMPYALYCNQEADRISVLSWYWNAKSMVIYGFMKRRYPLLPQDYIWQQQGILEFIRECENGGHLCSEALELYGVGTMLDFISTFGVSE